MKKNNLDLTQILAFSLIILTGAFFALQFGGCGKAVPESVTTTSSTSTTTSSTTTTTYSGWEVVTGTKMGTQEILVNKDFAPTGNRVTPSLGAGIAGEFGISFVSSSSDEGWAVGYAGDVLRTLNANAGTPTAEFINCGSGGLLQDVVAYTSNRVWIVGKDTVGSSVFYTGDAGKNWTVQFNTATAIDPGQRTGTYSDKLNMISIVVEGSNIYGWIAGGLGDNSSLILKTTNGTSWESSYHSATGTYDKLYSIYFIDKNNGMAVGERGVILKTSNGGTTWASQESGTTQDIYEIRMNSATEAVAAGNGGVVLRTTNGGTTWTPLTTGVTTNLSALEVRLSKIWVGGADGKIYYSSDNGSTWAAQTSNTNQPVNAITMLSDTYGWAACGQTSSAQGALLRTTKGGN